MDYCDHPWSDEQVAEMLAAVSETLGDGAAGGEVLETLPVLSAVMPSALRAVQNGKIPDSLLKPIDERGGRALDTFGRCWRAMRAAARAAGFDLWYTGVYRSYDAQVALLKSRASPVLIPHTWTRYWAGILWYGNGAPVATPGTSNHGWGIAIDAALKVAGQSAAQPISPAISWLIPRAATYGFSWESQIEPWHLRMVTGDNIPAAVLAYEQGVPPPPPPPPGELPVTEAEFTRIAQIVAAAIDADHGEMATLINNVVIGIARGPEFQAIVEQQVRDALTAAGVTTKPDVEAIPDATVAAVKEALANVTLPPVTVAIPDFDLSLTGKATAVEPT